ncbi:MAG: hypothetical protein AB1689_01935 [Thermodesulfobacteriota bacterium]
MASHSAEHIARRLEARNILLKPLGDRVLGPGYMRITTGLPDQNERFLATLAEVLGRPQ